MLASTLPPSFLAYIVSLCHLYDVRLYAVSLVFLFFGLLVEVLSSISRMVSSILQGQPLIRFLLYSLVLSCFIILLRYSFLNFFFHIHLFDGVAFQYSQVFVRFLFSKHSDFILVWYSCSFHCVVSHFSLLAWHIFLCHIQSLCSDYVFSLLLLGFPILLNQNHGLELSNLIFLSVALSELRCIFAYYYHY